MTDLIPILDCLALPIGMVIHDATPVLGAVQKFLQTAIHPMALFGWIGQGLFFSRFLVQWIVSEKQRQSTIPLAFWYLSISGGALFLVYALWRHDPILTIGQSVGLTVYARNLVLIRRAQRRLSTATDHA